MSTQDDQLDRRAFSVSLLGIVTSGITGTPMADVAKEVEQIEQQLVAAISALDLKTYDRLVADDYFVIQSSGLELTKAQVMDGYRSGLWRYKDLRIGDLKVHLYGDAAIITARTSGYRIEGDRETPNQVRYLRLYLKRQGKWQAVTQMSTPIPNA